MGLRIGCWTVMRYEVVSVWVGIQARREPGGLGNGLAVGVDGREQVQPGLGPLGRETADGEFDGEVARRLGHERDDIDRERQGARVEGCRDRDDREVAGNAQSAVGDLGEHRVVDLVGAVDEERRGAPVEQAADGLPRHLGVRHPVARDPEVMREPALGRPALEGAAHARGEVRLLVRDLGLTDEADRAVPRIGDAVDGEHRRGLEVEVDADEALVVVRHPDEDRRRVDRPREGDPLVVGGDIEHEDRVDESGCRDPRHPGRRLLVGQEQDVVVAAARGDRGREHERHVGRRVRVAAQRLGEREDVRPAAGEHPGAGVGAVPQVADGLLDAAPGRRRDGALAAERVRHGADRHAGGFCHLVDLRHADSVVQGGSCAASWHSPEFRESKRFAETLRRACYAHSRTPAQDFRGRRNIFVRPRPAGYRR